LLSEAYIFQTNQPAGDCKKQQKFRIVVRDDWAGTLVAGDPRAMPEGACAKKKRHETNCENRGYNEFALAERV